MVWCPEFVGYAFGGLRPGQYRELCTTRVRGVVRLFPWLRPGVDLRPVAELREQWELWLRPELFTWTQLLQSRQLRFRVFVRPLAELRFFLGL